MSRSAIFSIAISAILLSKQNKKYSQVFFFNFFNILMLPSYLKNVFHGNIILGYQLFFLFCFKSNVLLTSRLYHQKLAVYLNVAHLMSFFLLMI